ncbi:CD59 glycoprotein-like [Discoglossus pictus]
MKSNIVVAFLIFFFLRCQIGHTLNCYTCNLGYCENKLLTTCAESDHVCASYAVKLDGKWWKYKDCLPPRLCGKNTQEGFTDAVYHCCYIDRCNEAGTITVSLVTTGLLTLLAMSLPKL